MTPQTPVAGIAAGLILSATLHAQAPALAQAPEPAPREAAGQPQAPTLYVVPYAHLDTQWRWDYRTTITEYLPSTMRENFALFEKYPHYVFNFSGANRYRMMKEYYPADFETVRRYVAAGRWFPSGSSMEENDVNAPGAESIIRQVLYGKQFFRREFGRTSAEYMLPDCFGFPASLPSILAHAGIKGFSTQKLTWHSAARVGGPGSPQDTPPGVPFNVGFWEGLDGHGVVAALNATDYNGDVTEDLATSATWQARLAATSRQSGVRVDFRYYGTGDIGGSPREASVRQMESALTSPASPVTGGGAARLRLVQGAAERLFVDLTPAQVSRLPRYRGDLLLIEHSAGSISSQAYMKRWNRQNELLADAAERAAVAADWLGSTRYPRERLGQAWTLVAGGQFHDILPGTSLPGAYAFSWNDELLALNQFAGVLTHAATGVASALDTRGPGTTLVVYNPLNVDREDVVDATVARPAGAAEAWTGVRVTGPDGRDVPAQVAEVTASGVRVLFLARVPSIGFAAFSVQPSQDAPARGTLAASPTSLENERFTVAIDASGDVSRIYDKQLGRDVLSAPARLAIQEHRPVDWPAWNMDWADQKKPPRSLVGGPAAIRVVEQGPARVAVEIAREAEGSRVVQTVRLSAGGAGNRVEFANRIDWHTPAAALKATFPLAAANPVATYNWDIGTIERGNNDERKYQVPSHQWFDLTDAGGGFGTTVLSDCRYGSDKPDDRTLRLTLLYTPGIGTGNGRDYADQSTQDWGHHEFVYGLAPHAGDWRQERTDWQAQRLNQPLVAFASPAHPGPLGKTFSLLSVSSDRVRVLALKKAEASDEVIVRLVELDGRPARGVRVRFPSGITGARELTGAEEPVGPANAAGASLIANFTPYQPRTFAVTLARAQHRVGATTSAPVVLPADRIVSTADGEPAREAFDDAGRALPGELVPRRIEHAGVAFQLATTATGAVRAVVARGQTIALPAGAFRRLHLLAASADGDVRATFRAGERASQLVVQDWRGFVGQWDTRTWNTHQEAIEAREGEPAPAPGTPPRMRTVLDFTGLTPGYVKPAAVAWFASHHHSSQGTNEPYAYAYLFAYTIDLPPGATSVTLPDDGRVRVLAATVSDGEDVAPATPLYDALARPGGGTN